MVASLSLPPSMPSWALDELRGLQRLDPRLAAQLELEPAAFEVQDYAGVLGDPRLYVRVNEAAVLAPAPLAIFVFSWLKRGGAEYAGIALAREAQRVLGIENVLVIVLDWDVLESRDWLAPDTRLFAPMVSAPHLTAEQRGSFVRDYIAASHPRAVVNCNSGVFWDLTLSHGAALSQITRLYAFAFCFDATPGGTPIGYPASHLPGAQRYLTHVLGDHQAFGGEQKRTFGYSDAWDNIYAAVYQPIEMPDDAPARATGLRSGGRPKVLWASRICAQKRPELLLKIAALMPDYDFEVYGDLYEPQRYSLDEFQAANVSYKGSYATLKDLPTGSFDSFLYTSAYDGLPAIVLAAGALCMAVVTADVGGLREIIDDDTGWLVTDASDPASYVIALRRAVGDLAERDRRAQSLAQRVRARHSGAAYAARVAGLRLFDER